MVFASIREHASTAIFFSSTSRDKKFALRAASSLERTTREEQQALFLFFLNKTKYFKTGFYLERTKFFEASLSDTLSRSNQITVAFDAK